MKIFIIYLLLLMETVRSISPEELKFELAKADANSRRTGRSRGKSYRLRRSREDEENLRRTFGIASSRPNRRRAPVKNLVSENDVKVFFDEWLPRRSTLPPSTAVTRHQQSLRRPAASSESSRLSAKKRGEKKLDIKRKDGKIIRPQRPRPQQKINIIKKDISEQNKIDDDVVQALVNLLKTESIAIQKKVIKRKIEETKRTIKKLEKLREGAVKKQSRAFSAESQEFADWLGKSIEEQEIQRLSRQQRFPASFPYMKEIARPIPRIRSSGQIYTAKRKAEGYTGSPPKIREITEVTSSNFVLEGTPAPFNFFTAPKRAEVKRWRKPNPRQPPTLSSPRALRPQAFASLTVDGNVEKRIRPMRFLPKMSFDQNEIIEKKISRPPYPFSHCYVNKDGEMCCNRFLESLLRKSYQKARRSVRSASSDLNEIAQKIQADCEHVFNTTFEAIVSYEDYALRAHFAGDLVCKIDQDGKYITVYATSMPHRRGSRQDPLSIITPMALNAVEHFEDLDNNLRTPRALRRLPFHELSREDVENEKIFSNDISNRRL